MKITTFFFGGGDKDQWLVGKSFCELGKLFFGKHETY